jgi:hypothetical protein
MNRLTQHKTRVLITVDTEFRLGGSLQQSGKSPVPADRIIYCRFGGKEYGINWIMDTLEQHGLKGVFFVETESRFCFGEKLLASIVENICRRGHEVQVHCHPVYRTFLDGKRKSDDMRSYSLQEQTDIIGEALRFLTTLGVRDLRAYRSGGFFSTLDTVRAAQTNGLRYLSNYNLSVPNCDYLTEFPGRNDLFPIGDGFEIPITCFQEIPIRKDWNCLQICAASSREFRKAMHHYHTLGTNTLCILTHSFEFVRPRDIQYNRATPLPFLMQRLDDLCAFLSKNPDSYEVVGFAQLDALLQRGNIQTHVHRNEFFRSTALDTVRRYAENVLLSRIS